MKMKAVFAIILASMLTSCHVVQEGKVGVKTWFGKTKDDKSVLQPGMHIMGIGTNSYDFNVRTHKIDLKISAYTKDLQEATLTSSVIVRLKVDKVLDVFREYGKEWEMQIVTPPLLPIIKAEIGQWDAIQLVEGRNQATQKMEKALITYFEEKDLPVIIEGLHIQDILYKKEFEASVESKVIAQQNAMQEVYNTAKIMEQGKQKVEVAKAEAEAIRILSKSLEKNPKAIEWEIVKKWDGKTPMVVGDGQTILPLDKQR